MSVAAEEQGRLVTIQRRVLPVDVVAPQHAEIHGELEGWGRWSRERRANLKCGSAEGAHRARNGNNESWEFEPPRGTPARLPNPRMWQIDRAVQRIPMGHREVLVMYYVDGRRPEAICRAVVIHFAQFGRFIHDARCMIVNQLGRCGA